MKYRILAAAAVLAAGSAFAQAPNDAQIAHIVVTANQVDIDAGDFAQAHASADDVKAFARQIGRASCRERV